MLRLSKPFTAGFLTLGLLVGLSIPSFAESPTLAEKTVTGSTTSTTSTSSTTSTTTTLAPRPTVIPSSQTTQRPSTGGPLTQLLTSLWNDIISNNIVAARKLFFPLSAYSHLKGIPTPGYDWRVRLMAFFNLDFATYHHALTAGQVASLESIGIRQSYAHWIPPGYCENKLGYWHLPGPRFVYSQNGVTKSVGVLSLISWHGIWYIIHLGPNPRTTNGGELYNLANGPGVVGPPGSC